MTLTCARHWCNEVVEHGPYCSTECARVNALLTPPSGIPFPRAQAVPARAAAFIPQCSTCKRPVLIVYGPQANCRRAVNPDPVPGGSLVLRGDQVIAELRGSCRNWDGYAFEAHHCAAAAVSS